MSRIGSWAGFVAAWVICAGALACGGTSGQAGSGASAIPPLPPATTTGTLVGPLCKGTECECQSDTADPGVPESKAFKRFEVKIGPIDNDLWVKVGDRMLYKSRERATECFYIDLASPGKHRVTVRAYGEDGYAARVAISEIQTETGKYYDTFEFQCGGPGICDVDILREFRESLVKYKRSIHDPCGSTKIKSMGWQTGTLPDNMHPSDLYMQFVLDVYQFTPAQPPGHADCANNY